MVRGVASCRPFVSSGAIMRDRGHVRSRRKAKPPSRKLYLKFRVRPKVRMPRSVMFAKLRELLATGTVPDDLDVAYMSYDHGIGKQFQAGGRLTPDETEELEKFYNVLLAIGKEGINVEQRRGKRTANPAGGFGRVRIERPE